MQDVEILSRKVAQLESMVESLVMLKMSQAAGENQAMIGDGIPVMPIIGGGDMAPWTFQCDVDPVLGTRTGGWYRQILQVGMTVHNYNEPSEGFVDETNCLDGKYYLKVDLNENSVEIVRIDENAQPTFEDVPNGVLAVYIGTVINAVQTEGIYWAPVVYINL